LCEDDAAIDAEGGRGFGGVCECRTGERGFDEFCVSSEIVSKIGGGGHALNDIVVRCEGLRTLRIAQINGESSSLFFASSSSFASLRTRGIHTLNGAVVSADVEIGAAVLKGEVVLNCVPWVAGWYIDQ
jgi:hypothetical protein